ncbi:caffeic acid 3-O-methyltransferase 1-like, partial [Dendrobium catenatum]|uniref:caffeic acid 3-O-methyltransferase 1-like n=1 Tax=Dendrobium catenatum TaxID=906689 RepID=UPI0010A02C90
IFLQLTSNPDSPRIERKSARKERGAWFRRSSRRRRLELVGSCYVPERPGVVPEFQSANQQRTKSHRALDTTPWRCKFELRSVIRQRLEHRLVVITGFLKGLHPLLRTRLFKLLLLPGPGAQLSAEEFAAKLINDSTSDYTALKLERILRLLASYSVLTWSTETDSHGRTVHRFGASPVCKFLAPNEDGRVEHVGGDVFESIPSGEALLLKSVLHDWGDEDSLKILKNCWKSVPENGKVIVIDSFLPEAPDYTDLTHCVLNTDVIMLLESPSGKERTEKEFRELAELSGFSGFNVICNFSNAWIMELSK